MRSAPRWNKLKRIAALGRRVRHWLPPLREGTLRVFGFFKEHHGWAGIIGLINVVGIAYGFYYYMPQFRVTPVWLWPFVPDSPLAVLWAELALLAFWFRRKPGVLDALAFIGNVQVGFWTVYVLLVYEDAFHTLDFVQGEGGIDLNTVLLLAHAAMALLALIFLHGLRQRARLEPRAVGIAIALATAYYFLQDILDYVGPGHYRAGCGMRPYTVPCDARETGLAIFTFVLTAAGALTLWLLARHTRSPEIASS